MKKCCEKCGNEIDDKYIWCPVCGTKNPKNEPDKSIKNENKYKCSKCGSIVYPNTKFCENCGESVVEVQELIKQKEKFIKKSNRKVLRNLLIIFAVIVFIIISFIVFKVVNGILTESKLKEQLKNELINDLYNIDYDEIEITKIGYCKTDICKASCDGCYSYEKLPNCREYDVKIYLDKNNEVGASIERFDDGTIRKSNIFLNIDFYLTKKKVLDKDFKLKYKKLVFKDVGNDYSYVLQVYLNDNLYDVLDEELLKNTVYVCEQMANEENNKAENEEKIRRDIEFVFNDKYYINNDNSANFKMKCHTDEYDGSINYILGPSWPDDAWILETTNYKNEVKKIKSLIESNREK